MGKIEYNKRSAAIHGLRYLVYGFKIDFVARKGEQSQATLLAQVVQDPSQHTPLSLGTASGVGKASGRSSDELIDLETNLFGRGTRIEIDFLVAVLAATLQGFVATATGNDSHGQNFQGGEEAKVAEQAEVLLPGGPFGQNGECSIHDSLGLKEFVGSDGHQFVVGGKIVDEIGEIAFQIIGIAKEYELHTTLPWGLIDL